MTRRGRVAPRARVKKYLIAGLLVWLPLAVTIWVLQAVLGLLDGVFVWLLERLAGRAARGQPRLHRDAAAGSPASACIVMLLGLLLTGVFATNVAGQWALRQGHRLLNRIPIVKSIYSSVQQVSDTLFSSSGNAFREAVLVQYPRDGSWTIAFVTGKPGGEAAHAPAGRLPQRLRADDAEPDLGLFPDAAARRRRSPLAMSVDEALKYVISMGVVAPPTRSSAAPPADAKSARLSARPALSPSLPTHADSAVPTPTRRRSRPRSRQECME